MPVVRCRNVSTGSLYAPGLPPAAILRLSGSTQLRPRVLASSCRLPANAVQPSHLIETEKSSSTYYSSMQIHTSDPLVGPGYEQLAQYELLDSENNSILAAQSDGGTRIVDSLVGVLDLS